MISKSYNFFLGILIVFLFSSLVFGEDKIDIWKNKKILARFISVLSICWPDGKIYSSMGKIEGFISPKKKGKNGFGYDPIFIPFKRRLTFAEMRPKEKLKIDHRFNAFKKIKKFF